MPDNEPVEQILWIERNGDRSGTNFNKTIKTIEGHQNIFGDFQIQNYVISFQITHRSTISVCLWGISMVFGLNSIRRYLTLDSISNSDPDVATRTENANRPYSDAALWFAVPVIKRNYTYRFVLAQVSDMFAPTGPPGRS